MTRARLIALAVAAALALPVGWGAAGAARAAGKERPLTTAWECDNGRSVLFNAHPRRPREEAWVTYLGNRVEVHLARAALGARYESKDGKVIWHTQGPEATLEFAGLLHQPLNCKRKTAAGTAKK